MAELQMRVIEISRGTTHDGPGVRTTVFLKGCPLRCGWCQNPEGLHAQPEVWWEGRTCIRCLACLTACPTQALTAGPAGLLRNQQVCTRCGACVAACPARAMSFTSRDWPIGALVREALKDRDYYQAFGGGVTVSGGEPLGQVDSVVEFFRRLHAAGVHTALDTCGLAPPSAFAAVLPHTDQVLFDLKLLDPVLHQTHTGQSNQTILANLALIAAHLRTVASSMRLWIRTPLIPAVTATEENLHAIGQYIRSDLADVVERWELCAFNNACKSKYAKLGLPWSYAEKPLLRRSEVEALHQAALAAGGGAVTVVVSGLTAT